ncbi:MAG: sulfide/dihydroorotate dehydrogenase-like FAD/NAD-binding protein, partial [Coriobacteriales bacterium]|nr:sulfide/dihydroorotate dehydrogenase-like FAD/NAD-binding protein [Coriobacteriales bacterium]
MNKIVSKRMLHETIVLLEIEAPEIAAKTQTGQFVVIRIDEVGERIPLTVADQDLDLQTISVIFQIVGASTLRLADLNPGDCITDLVGPLGLPTQIPEGVQRVCIVGGGLGCAIAYPQAKTMQARGFYVDMVAGFRSYDLVILEDEMRQVTDRLFITTDDGSYGEQGFVTSKLESLINSGESY